MDAVLRERVHDAIKPSYRIAKVIGSKGDSNGMEKVQETRRYGDAAL
jgi:hypothetical protein